MQKLDNRIECYVYELKLGWQCGLNLVGAENNKPQWLGTKEQFDDYYLAKEKYEANLFGPITTEDEKN